MRKKYCNEKFKKLLLASTLVVASEFIAILINIIIAGQMLGENALAAVNLVTPVYSLISFLAVAVGMGASFCFGEEISHFNKRGAQSFFSQGMISAAAVGILSWALLFFGRNLILGFMGPTHALYYITSQYYMYMVFLALILPLQTVLAYIVNADGGETICIIAYIPQVVLSTVLSIVLCGSMGISGIAVGTLIGQAVTIFVLSIHFFTKKCSLKFRPYFNVKSFIFSMKYSVADAGPFLLEAIAFYVINWFFITTFGHEKMPVLTTLTSMVECTFLFEGIGSAVEPLIGIYRNEHNMRSIRSLMKTAGIVALAEGVLAAAVYELFPEIIIRILGITNSALIADGVEAVRMLGVALIFISIMPLFSSLHLCFEEFEFVIMDLFLKDLLLPIACIVICGELLGTEGVWLGFSAGYVLALVIFLVVMLIKKGRNGFPLYLDRSRDETQQLFNIPLNSDAISDTSSQAQQFIRDHGGNERCALKAALAIEEALVQAQKKGEGKTVAECLVDCTAEDVVVTIRDTGKLKQLTEEGENEKVGTVDLDLGAYVFQMMAQQGMSDLGEMIALGANRVRMEFPKND